MSEQRMSSQLAESLEQSTFHCQRSEWEISPFLVVTFLYIPRLYLILNTGRVCVLPPWKEVHGDIWDQQTRDGRPHHNFLQGELLMLVLVLGGLIHFFRWEAELPRWEINLPKWDTRASRWVMSHLLLLYFLSRTHMWIIIAIEIALRRHIKGALLSGSPEGARLKNEESYLWSRSVQT